jgi:molecular chaperone GrpE
VSEEAKAEIADQAAPAEPEKKEEPDYFDQLLRLKAEFENYRKRVDREKPEYFRMGKAEVIARLLPIYDLLHQAHVEVQASHVDTPLAKGMEMIFKEFEKIFKEEEVLPMTPVGKPYDAERQEVVGTVEKEGAPDGEVVDVLQAGFLHKGKVLRTAKVRIAKNKA